MAMTYAEFNMETFDAIETGATYLRRVDVFDGLALWERKKGNPKIDEGSRVAVCAIPGIGKNFFTGTDGLRARNTRHIDLLSEASLSAVLSYCRGELDNVSQVLAFDNDDVDWNVAKTELERYGGYVLLFDPDNVASEVLGVSPLCHSDDFVSLPLIEDYLGRATTTVIYSGDKIPDRLIEAHAADMLWKGLHGGDVGKVFGFRSDGNASSLAVQAQADLIQKTDILQLLSFGKVQMPDASAMELGSGVLDDLRHHVNNTHLDDLARRYPQGQMAFLLRDLCRIWNTAQSNVGLGMRLAGANISEWTEDDIMITVEQADQMTGVGAMVEAYFSGVPLSHVLSR